MNAQSNIGQINSSGLLGSFNATGFLTDSINESGIKYKSSGGLVPLIASAGIWLSANDSVNNLYVAAHNVLGNNHDFWQGPLSVLDAQAANPSEWDKISVVNKFQIQQHIKKYSNTNYQVPMSISNWPGSGKTPYANVLAPFVDVNQNNLIYEPENGDYPYTIGDEESYLIFNDNFASHTYSQGKNLGVEVHARYYTFTNDDNALKNCILAQYTVFNRSNINYSNFKFSQAIQYKIGSKWNEYLYTNVPNKTLFAINDTSEATYSNKLVSIGCMMLNKPLQSTMYYEASNDTIYGAPTSAVEFNRLMNGKWKNNKMLTYGGNGVDGSGNAKYVYPFQSDQSNNGILWSEQSAGIAPGRKIGLLNSDSYSLKRGQNLTFDFVFFLVDEKYNDIKQLDTICLNIKQELTQKNITKNDVILRKKLNEMLVFPNPICAGEKLSIVSKQENIKKLIITDIRGVKRVVKNFDNYSNSIILDDYLPKGIYLIQVQTLNTLYNQKLIIE